VTKWDDQTKLFDLAYQSFGSVDVVLPNAGVTELFSFDVEEKQNGKRTLLPVLSLSLDCPASASLSHTDVDVPFYDVSSVPSEPQNT
jgi:hypothetical protein